MSQIQIFISHSSADEKVAKVLIDLLRDAFRIEPNQIRCTSVPGYKLPAGAHAESQLRQEIRSAPIFIGLLSEVSLDSAYVLFELGARWSMIQEYGGYGGGLKNKIFPLLAAGATGSIIRDPLKAYNALSVERQADLHQLVAEVGQELHQTPTSAAAYQDKIDRLIAASRQVKGQRTRASKPKVANTEKAATNPVKSTPAKPKSKPSGSTKPVAKAKPTTKAKPRTQRK